MARKPINRFMVRVTTRNAAALTWTSDDKAVRTPSDVLAVLETSVLPMLRKIVALELIEQPASASDGKGDLPQQERS